jgi:hypothetical protein
MPQTFNVGSRSLFVTAVAWVFIVLGALASLSALVQNATVASMAPGTPVLAGSQPLPWLTGLLMGYLPWVVGAGLAVSLATLVCAIGLLLRVEWARRIFIGPARAGDRRQPRGVVGAARNRAVDRERHPGRDAAAPGRGRRLRRLRGRHPRHGDHGVAGRLRSARLDDEPAHVAGGSAGIHLTRPSLL